MPSSKNERLRQRHTFVPGDLVRWKTTGLNMPKEWQLGLVIGSLGGTEQEVEEMITDDQSWFRITVFWMPCADLGAKFDTHPISSLKLA